MKGSVFLSLNPKGRDTEIGAVLQSLLLFMISAVLIAISFSQRAETPVVQANHISKKCVAVRDPRTGENIGCSWLEENINARYDVEWVGTPAEPHAPAISG